MKALLSDGRVRPILFGALGVFAVLQLATGPIEDAVEASSQIEAGRDRLARIHDAAGRPPHPSPLVGPDADSLLAAFRGRLEALAASRAAVVEQAVVTPDPGRPNLPRLQATLRGTAEGLHGLLHALETEAPLLPVEEAEIGIERAADAEGGRPTVMRASLTARGVLHAATVATGSEP